MEIKVNDLGISFDNKEILRDISLSLQDKEFVGLIGPNGSGKSTFLKCLYRVLKPWSGKIFFDKEDIIKIPLKHSAQKLAVVAQHNYSNFDFKVNEVVLMGRSPYKGLLERHNNDDYKRVSENLNLVGMAGFENENFSILSGGEQQRVLLARALTQATNCLLLDEPTNHLEYVHTN